MACQIAVGIRRRSFGTSVKQGLDNLTRGIRGSPVQRRFPSSRSLTEEIVAGHAGHGSGIRISAMLEQRLDQLQTAIVRECVVERSFLGIAATKIRICSVLKQKLDTFELVGIREARENGGAVFVVLMVGIRAA